MRVALFVLPAALLSLVVVGAGCSTPSVEGDPLSVGPSSKSKTKKGNTTDAGAVEPDTTAQEPTTTPDADSTGTEADAGAPPATGACAGSATADACFTCCEQQAPQGLPILQQAFGNCVCGTGTGNCAAECGGSFCAGAPPSALCEKCLDAANTCRLQADTACEQTPACNALFQCDDASKCASKP